MIRVERNTTISDIESWDSSESTYSLSAESSFALFAEGLAMGRLQSQIANGSQVSLHVAATNNREMTADWLADNYPVFSSLFGMQLLHLASNAYGGVTHSTCELLYSVLWEKSKQSRGLLIPPHGRSRYVLSRDPDSPLPDAFMSQDGGFPERADFRQPILGLAAEITGRQSAKVPVPEATPADEDIISFLFETAQNAHQHARVGIDGRLISGVRGIIVDKVATTSAGEAAIRRDLETETRSYIISRQSALNRPAVFLCVSVADLGPGIQNTLPPRDGETPEQRLLRSFRRRETRFGAPSPFKLGMGLHFVNEAARRLNALLFVRSADLLGIWDLSSGVGPGELDSSDVGVIQQRSALGTHGTTIGMIWQYSPALNDEQFQLFESHEPE